MTWQTLEDSRIIDIIGFGESVDQVLKIIHCLDLLGGLTVTCVAYPFLLHSAGQYQAYQTALFGGTYTVLHVQIPTYS